MSKKKSLSLLVPRFGYQRLGLPTQYRVSGIGYRGSAIFTTSYFRVTRPASQVPGTGIFFPYARENIVEYGSRPVWPPCISFSVTGFRVELVRSFGFRVSGFGFRVAGVGFRVAGFGSRDSGLGLRVAGCGLRVSGFDCGLQVSGFGFRVSGFGFRILDFEFRSQVSGFRFWVSGFGFRISGFGFRVSGFGFWVSGFGIRVAGVHLYACRGVLLAEDRTCQREGYQHGLLFFFITVEPGVQRYTGL